VSEIGFKEYFMRKGYKILEIFLLISEKSRTHFPLKFGQKFIQENFKTRGGGVALKESTCK
jgi:hypothetical protein